MLKNLTNLEVPVLEPDRTQPFPLAAHADYTRSILRGHDLTHDQIY